MTIHAIKCLTLSAILLLTSCASTPTTHNYYLIESPASKTTINSDKKIVLYPIELSNYLRSSSLHVKDGSSQVIYSATDSWAEQLDKIVWRAMEQSLENLTGYHVLASYETEQSCAQIKIRVDELSPSTSGKVISNGRWFISHKGKALQTNKFSFSGDINVDGYTASNKVFAEHFHRLSGELKEKINQLALCQS